MEQSIRNHLWAITKELEGRRDVAFMKELLVKWEAFHKSTTKVQSILMVRGLPVSQQDHGACNCPCLYHIPIVHRLPVRRHVVVRGLPEASKKIMVFKLPVMFRLSLQLTFLLMYIYPAVVYW
jgi:hypothetical protein